MKLVEMKKWNIVVSILVCVGLLFVGVFLVSCQGQQSEYDKYIDKHNSGKTIGIAWTTNQSTSFDGAKTAIEKTGAKAVALDQVKANYLQYSSDKQQSTVGGNQDMYTLNQTNSSTNAAQKTDIQELAQDAANT